MSWSDKSSKHYQSREYKAARMQVVRRDMGLCFRCEYFGRIVPFDAVDHFNPLHKLEVVTHDVAAMWCLCKDCHDEKTHLESLGKNYAFKSRVDPETGYDFDEPDWLGLISARTEAKRHRP